MNKIIKVIIGIIGIVVLLLIIMAIFNICSPSRSPPWCSTDNNLSTNNNFNKNTNNINITNDINIHNIIDNDVQTDIEKQESQLINYNITVSVPYWTNSDVYLGVDNNPEFLKLNKINDTLFIGHVKLPTNLYYFTRNHNSRSLNDFNINEPPFGINTVIDWNDSNKLINKPSFQKGITFGGMLWNQDYLKTPGLIEYNLKIAKNLGVNYILIIPDWFLYPDVNSTSILPWYDNNGEFPNKSNWVTSTLTDSEIEDIINKARKYDLKVVIKPHIDPINWSPEHPKGRGDIQPNDWDKWYDNYTNFILYYAKLAQKNKVELFVIGTEIDPAAMEGHPYGPKNGGQTKYFGDLISKIKKVYSGKLTYSASCYGECWAPRGVKFWDKLDYIGFEPYQSITSVKNPTIDELKQGFLKELEFAKKLHEQYNKPILFTEIGAPSFEGSAKYMLDTPPIINQDLVEQADIYEAIFQDIEKKDWIVGMYPWALYLVKPNDSLEWQLKDTSSNFIGKPAGQVIKKWYGKIN